MKFNAYTECCFADCHLCYAITLSVVNLSVVYAECSNIVPNAECRIVCMLSVIALNVVNSKSLKN
jgi:hypothetical protein